LNNVIYNAAQTGALKQVGRKGQTATPKWEEADGSESSTNQLHC